MTKVISNNLFGFMYFHDSLSIRDSNLWPLGIILRVGSDINLASFSIEIKQHERRQASKK